MRVTLRLDRRATYADYLAAEQGSPTRHEFLDGVIVAMAGGSDEHNAITNKLAASCVMRLTGRCRSYSPDQRFWIAVNQRGRYSDGSIIVVVFEVLSPSSEGDDEGDKRLDFQSLVSLHAYVVAAQDERCVKVYRRAESGEWHDEPHIYRDGQLFELPTLSIAVAEIYDGILDPAGGSLLLR